MSDYRNDMKNAMPSEHVDCHLPLEAPSRLFGSAGLNLKEVEMRRKHYGPNLLSHPSHLPLWRRLLSQLTHFFAIMLWIAGVLAILAGMPQIGLAVFVVIVLNGLFAFLQEYRAEKAGERIRDLLPRRVMVRREAGTRSIDAIELVPDDVVVLERMRPHFRRYALSRSPKPVH
jgi:magnesium-transporting ATPase (P-type)